MLWVVTEESYKIFTGILQNQERQQSKKAITKIRI